MTTHRHKWIQSARGMSENPGIWSEGAGIVSCSACACGACKQDYTDPPSRRIIMPGEYGWNVEDVQNARGAMEVDGE